MEIFVDKKTKQRFAKGAHVILRKKGGTEYSGVVEKYDEALDIYFVRFDDKNALHDGVAWCFSNFLFPRPNGEEEERRKAKRKKVYRKPELAELDNIITITVDKRNRKTILTDKKGRKEVVRCHPSDEFVEEHGVIIALERYYDGFACGDKVYTVQFDGNVYSLVYHGRADTKELIKSGNAFKTRKEAEKVAKKIRAIFDETRAKV